MDYNLKIFGLTFLVFKEIVNNAPLLVFSRGEEGGKWPWAVGGGSGDFTTYLYPVWSGQMKGR